MTKTEILKLRRSLKSLQKKLGNLGPVMRGSVVMLGPKNKPKRICFSLNKDGKTKMMYLGKKREDKAKEYSQNYKELLGIVEEMTAINMTLLKENAAQ
jgi:hypothetical protein